MAHEVEFETVVASLREGRITYEAFAAATRRRWEALAGWLMRRWRVPGWVQPTDVVQELLLGAWIGVWQYEPGRGTRTLSEHVVYTATDKAKKRMHKTRGVCLHGNPDGQASRILDVPLVAFGEAGQRMVEERESTPATQEDQAIRRQRVRRQLARCETIEEVVVLQALAEADSLEGGAELVYGDEDARALLRIEDERDAARLVVRVAGALAKRFNDNDGQAIGEAS